MQLIISDERGIGASVIDGRVYLAPSVDRAELAVLLMRLFMEANQPAIGGSVTWGSAYTPIGADQGGA